MRYLRSRRHLAVAVIAALVVFPATAWAGKKVISGQQSLQIKVTLHPARAGARGLHMHIHVVYLNSKHPSQQPPYNTKSLTLVEVKGLVVHTAVVRACKESVLIADAGNAPKACPASSKVGHGTVIANARPTIPSLISGTITTFNAVDDSGADGFPKGSGALILYIKTSIGVAVYDIFHVVNRASGEKLIAQASKPTTPGVTPGSFTLQQLDLTITGSGKHPYITAPAKCTGHWPFALTIRNWFGQPAVTAHDRAACTP